MRMDERMCSGDLLKVWALESTDDGCEVAFLERNVRLSASVAGHEAIIENAGNAWFQPAPTAGCLEDLWEAISRFLSEVEEDDSDDSRE